MLIPYNTDAPVYHFPYATIGLIVTNVAVYLATTAQVDDLNDWESIDFLILNFDTINPFQWLSGVFMHAGLMHLIGNMIFLWVFGLIVEGKLGWWRFLAIYLAIGIATSATEQVGMFFLSDGTGGCLGASGVIYGLLAIALVWAPKNEISCIVLIFIRPFMYDLPVTVVAGLFVGLQLFFLVLAGFQMSSELLHFIGFVAGLPIGVLFVLKRWVDCEGWDFFSVYGGRNRPSNTTSRDKARAERLISEHKLQREKETTQLRRLNESIQQAMADHQWQAASAIYRRHLSEFQGGRRLENKTLTGLVPALQKQKEWDLAIPLLVEWIRRLPPERAVPLRLNLAQILAQVAERPRQALAVLKKLPDILTADQTQRAQALKRLADKAIAEGSYEVEIHDW